MWSSRSSLRRESACQVRNRGDFAAMHFSVVLNFVREEPRFAMISSDIKIQNTCCTFYNFRGEVARALGRAAIGHSVYFQDAVHVHQKTSAAILQSSNSAESAKSAPAGGAQETNNLKRGMEDASARKVSSSMGKVASDHESRSPGVRLKENLGSVAYEPTLHIGLDEANLGEFSFLSFCLIKEWASSSMQWNRPMGDSRLQRH